jgi:N-acyl-D-amino-acid deacylase
MLFDLVICNGLMFDGSGGRGERLDVGIEGDEIKEIGRIPRSHGKRVVDAAGMVVSPGFIDLHSHGDMVLASGEKQMKFLEGRITQGITTEVLGNCGQGVAPVDSRSKPMLEKIGAWMSPEGLEWPWKSVGEYLSFLENRKVAVNVIPLIGHGPIRITVMGLRSGEASAKEMEEMRLLVKEGMEAGAFGFSCGLVYPPGMYTSTYELIELCRAMRPFGGLFTSHIRGSSELLIDAVAEIIEIGEKAGVSVQHSHNEAFGKNHFRKIEKTLDMESEARKRGIDIAFDVFPYTAAATNMLANYPPWTLEGGVQEFVRRLKDHETRERIGREVETKAPAWPPWTEGGWPHNLVMATGWENIYVSNLYLEKNKRFLGKNMTEVAKFTGKTPFDALSDLMIEEEGLISQLIFGCSGEKDSEDWLGVLIQDAWGAISTDAIDVGKGVAHPAAYGTYPRILGKYVREKGLLSLEEAIRKMTSLPASRVGLKNRGRLEKGMKADIVVFNPQTIRDRATYENPRQLSEGIEYVLINGHMVVEKGEYKGGFAGKVLRRGSSEFS